MSDEKTEWRRRAGRTGRSVSVTIPSRLATELGIKPGMVLQIQKQSGWFAVRVDPSQEPISEESSGDMPPSPPAEQQGKTPAEEPAVECTDPPKEKTKDDRICAFDL